MFWFNESVRHCEEQHNINFDWNPVSFNFLHELRAPYDMFSIVKGVAEQTQFLLVTLSASFIETNLFLLIISLNIVTAKW